MEGITFVGFEDNGTGKIVARFVRQYSMEEDLYLDRENCEFRLKNLEEGGFPHEETASVCRRWPETLRST